MHEPVILELAPPIAEEGATATMADAETVEPQAAAVTTRPRRQRGAPKPIFTAPEGEPDDLKRITGVGPVLEQKLRDLGVTQFDQIANFNDEDVEKIDRALNIKGRVAKDNWVGQARSLAGT